MVGGNYIQEGDILADKYRVERCLGRGGMGMVVVAWHIDLQERRALKFMLPDPNRSRDFAAEAVERFMREARSATKLESDHVVRIYDVARLADGVPYIVMEYLDGMDLDGVLRSNGGPLSVEVACRYILQACKAIGQAHELGIVHRDLKPANLFLARNKQGEMRIKVLDFGIAKVTAGVGAQHPSLTIPQSTMGTPAYMSPEQVSDTKAVDGRADIWSLGVILYQLTTCGLPFFAEHMPVLFAKILDDREIAPPPSQLNPAIPPEFDAVVLRCLQKNIHFRYQSIGQLVDDLTRFVAPGTRASAPVLPPMNMPTMPMPTLRKELDTPPNSSDAVTIRNPMPAGADRPVGGSAAAGSGQTLQGGLVKSVAPSASMRNAVVAGSITTAFIAALVVWFMSTRDVAPNPSPGVSVTTSREAAPKQEKPPPEIPAVASASPQPPLESSASATSKPTKSQNVQPPKSTHARPTHTKSSNTNPSSVDTTKNAEFDTWTRK